MAPTLHFGLDPSRMFGDIAGHLDGTTRGARHVFSPQRNQSDSAQRSASPRRIQWFWSMDDGMRIIITKLVEWPVVDNTPRRAAVRYLQQRAGGATCSARPLAIRRRGAAVHGGR